MEDKVVTYLLENFTLYFRTKTTVKINGKEVRRKKFFDYHGQDIITELQLDAEFYKNYRKERDQEDFFVDALEKAEIEIKAQAEEDFKTDVLPESVIQVNYIPLVDCESNEKYLVNPQTLEVSNMNYDTWTSTLMPEEKKALPQVTRVAKFVYDPYNLDTFVMVPFENYDILRVNTYRPPEWRKRENPGKATCPEEIGKVIKHLFPDKESRTYILDWLYNALVHRNEAYLVLNGAKGCGKGVFCEIVKHLVGSYNYTEAPDSFLESQFNSTLDKKRVIVLDEFKVDKAKHTKLKRYINKFQNIEKKGKDADTAVETFNSFIISNNDVSDMYLEYDDRRFSAADLNENPLTESMEADSIKALVKQLETDPELIHQFGYFIFNRGCKVYDEFSIFKGDKYHSLVLNSLKLWQKFIVEEIFKSDTEWLSVEKLRILATQKDARIQIPSSTAKIQDFLKNYKHGGETSLGEARRIEKETWIHINKELIEDEEENDEEIL